MTTESRTVLEQITMLFARLRSSGIPLDVEFTRERLLALLDIAFVAACLHVPDDDRCLCGMSVGGCVELHAVQELAIQLRGMVP